MYYCYIYTIIMIFLNDYKFSQKSVVRIAFEVRIATFLEHQFYTAEDAIHL